MAKLIRDWDLDKFNDEEREVPRQKIRKKKKQFKEDEKIKNPRQ